MSKDKPKSLWEILVPKYCTDEQFDNIQKAKYNPTVKMYEISMPHHHEWDDYVINVTGGGLTVMRSGKGTWICPKGKRVEESMIPVRILCTTKQINDIASFTKDHYAQEAIMFYKISDECYIK